MGLGKKLQEWSAASNALERERDARLPDAGRSSGDGATEVRIVVTLLKMVAVLAAVVGPWCGIAVGRSLEGWSRPFGLAAPGWIVVLGAVVSAMLLYALACGLGCLDQIRRNTSP